jgi:hypothetical protein
MATPNDDHLTLLCEMRDLLRKLPDDLVSRLRSGPGGGLFPEGAPVSGRQQASSDGGPQSPEDEAEAGARARGGRVRAYENAGFALGRFISPLGQLAGFSRDIRAVMEAFGALKGKTVQEGINPLQGGFARVAGANLDNLKREQEAVKGFNQRPPDWLTQAKLQGKDVSGRLGSSLGPAALKLSGVARPGEPMPTAEELARALGARGPQVPPQTPRAAPSSLPAVPSDLARAFGLDRSKQTQLAPPVPPGTTRTGRIPTARDFPAQTAPAGLAGGLAAEGFPPPAAGGVASTGPVLSGGVGQQIVAKLDQLISLATGQRQQQQDDAADTPDDKTRHTEDQGPESFWKQERAAGPERGNPSLDRASTPPPPAKQGGEGIGEKIVESIAEKLIMAAITAAL